MSNGDVKAKDRLNSVFSKSSCLIFMVVITVMAFIAYIIWTFLRPKHVPNYVIHDPFNDSQLILTNDWQPLNLSHIHYEYKIISNDTGWTKPEAYQICESMNAR